MADSADDESTESLTIYLAKPNVSAPTDLLKITAGLKQFPIKDGDGPLGVLYAQPRKAHPPRWARLFEGQVDVHSLGRTSSTAAALIVEIEKRIFAVTFGQGRHMLKVGAVEDRFGRLVTLNAVGENRVRSLDKQTFDVLSRHTRVQSSREARPTELGIDVDQELLRTFTGAPEDESLGKTVSGVESLHALVKVDVNGLRNLLKAYLEQYGKDSYKKRFPWADQIAAVEDPELLAELNDALEEAIDEEDFDHCWLAVPEPIDWSQVAGFRYGRRPPVLHDISFTTFVQSVGEDVDIDIPLLQRRDVYCLGVDDVELYVWSVYKCVNFETSVDGSTYLLSGGRWFSVRKGLVKQVNEDLALIPSYERKLPDYGDETEGQYNQRVAKSDPKTFSLMDVKLIPWGGGSSRVEFCDLYTSDRDLIHVKRYGGSALLSHLFAQGTHSAELFVTEKGFREEVNKLLGSTHKFDPDKRPDTGKYTVVFAIVSYQPGNELTLPFFSKLSLRLAARQLRGFGYNVALGKIAVDDTVAKTKKYGASKAGKKKKS